MKQLLLDQAYAVAITQGALQHILLVGDDQELTVHDEVEVINTDDQAAVGTLTIQQMLLKRLSEFDDAADALVGESFEQTSDLDQVAKQITFVFSAYDEKHPLADNDVSNTTELTEVKLYGDGGSRGNPGPAASGWVIFDLEDTIIKEGGYYLGITTNNQAEYTALKKGLLDVQAMDIKRVQVYLDSLLVVNQMKGIFKIKSKDLIPIYNDIKQLASWFDEISFTHVPRALNKEADRMVNETLDDIAARGK